jgi:hypothetical protein
LAEEEHLPLTAAPCGARPFRPTRAGCQYPARVPDSTHGKLLGSVPGARTAAGAILAGAFTRFLTTHLFATEIIIAAGRISRILPSLRLLLAATA